MSHDISHDLLDLLPEPHRTVAKRQREDAARKAAMSESDGDGIPRHLRVALLQMQRAFEQDEPYVLGTFNEDLQPVIDAVIAWGRRGAKMRPDGGA